MTTSTIQRTIMVIEHPENVLLIGPHFCANTVAALIKSRGVVLWDNNGMWGVLAGTQLRDLLERYEMAQAHNEKYPRIPFQGFGIYFNSIVPISSYAVRALRLNN